MRWGAQALGLGMEARQGLGVLQAGPLGQGGAEAGAGAGVQAGAAVQVGMGVEAVAVMKGEWQVQHAASHQRMPQRRQRHTKHTQR